MRKDKPELVFADRGRAAGEAWKLLDEAGRAKYVAAYEADARRYAAEKKEWETKKQQPPAAPALDVLVAAVAAVDAQMPVAEPGVAQKVQEIQEAHEALALPPVPAILPASAPALVEAELHVENEADWVALARNIDQAFETPETSV